jgi:hypothetical protein
MLPPQVTNLLALIPNRQSRKLTGTPFALNDLSSGRGGQLAHIAPFLVWTGPLVSLTREEQQALGLLAPHGRPAHEGDEGVSSDEEDEPEPEFTNG